MLCALLAVPLLGGGWLWLRDSSLVSVRHVRIAGVQGIDGAQIRTALEDAATRMTTLDFNLAALRSAVAQYPIVAGLHVRTGFPHNASIVVIERQPVAALLDSGQRTAVAADGTVLGAAYLSSSLPTVDASARRSWGRACANRLRLPPSVCSAAAPASLERFVVRAYDGPEGLTVAMRTGLLVYFGNATRPHAKWLSLARVLVSPGSAGATYIDVRLPERPAAGFSSSLPAISSSSTSSSTSAAAATASECASGCASGETAATLASRLEASIGVGATAAVSPSEPSGTDSAGGSASAPVEASSSSGTETGSAPAGGESSGSPSVSATGASGAPSEAATTPVAGG